MRDEEEGAGVNGSGKGGRGGLRDGREGWMDGGRERDELHRVRGTEGRTKVGANVEGTERGRDERGMDGERGGGRTEEGSDGRRSGRRGLRKEWTDGGRDEGDE